MLLEALPVRVETAPGGQTRLQVLADPMTDPASNLPSRDLSITAAFYGTFGFVKAHRDEHWMVLRRGPLQLDFFRKDDLDPRHHEFGCSLGRRS